jgi:hypothetical protein
MDVPTPADDEAAVREVLGRIEAAWKSKSFDGLDDCFHPDALITGPEYIVYAAGRAACAESYREFAAHASVLDYSESNHALHIWGGVAVFTWAWTMTYQREAGLRSESGTDQLTLGRDGGRWSVLFRHIHFAPSPESRLESP